MYEYRGHFIVWPSDPWDTGAYCVDCHAAWRDAVDIGEDNDPPCNAAWRSDTGVIDWSDLFAEAIA